MSTGNWFRTRRRQVVIHSCIIVGFLVFTLFAAEPLFDRLERVPGEAQVQQFELPAETGGVRYAIDAVLTEGGVMLETGGWAFIEGRNMQLDESFIYIALRSESHTYVFDTYPSRRGDVTAHFEELDLNLDWSGFITNIPIRRVASGEYTIGIYIRTGDVEALQYTLHTVEL